MKALSVHLAVLACFVGLGTMPGLNNVASAQPCVPSPDRVPRESTLYHNPTPDADLRAAVAELQRLDPQASVGFSDCEVDYFSSKPLPTIPPYALGVLRRAGMPTTPQPIELYPDPLLAAKAMQNLDSTALRNRQVPLTAELDVTPPPDTSEGGDPADADPQPGRPILEERTEPPIDLEPRPSRFTRLSAEQLRRESALAEPILKGFLEYHEHVFRVRPHGLPGFKLVNYQVGRFFRKATFAQQVRGEPVLDGHALVLFDANWNVVGISRTLYTTQNLNIARTRTISRRTAEDIARREVAALTGKPPTEFAPGMVVRGLDPVRRVRAWQVQMVSPQSPEFDFTVLLLAQTGAVLNISDNVDAFTDAKTRRWGYSDGDQTQPFQIISTGIYTRDDNTLRHDFFFLETDERGGGDQVQCTQDDSAQSLWREAAWGVTDSPDAFIRHTHRSDRDFSIWTPSQGSGSFGESHTYFWSRWYYQWMKPALNELGVLPGDSADFPKIAILVNTCIDDIGYANSSLAVTIQHDEGEEEGKVRLADKCRQGNPQCTAPDYDISNSGNFLTCEGGGCYPSPSVIHHEINHRVLGGMFGVGSGLDCGNSDQRKFLHEGLLGSVLPQAFWHFWYGPGFNPSEKLRYFTGNRVRGRIHEDSASNLLLTDYLCVDNLSGQGPYEAGRVAGQPLWEFYHGKRVAGDQIFNTYRPATDTDFLILAYQAAELMANSTYKDRYEFANRVMQILEASNWPTAAKQDYCEIFDHHQLDNFINPAYCS